MNGNPNINELIVYRKRREPALGYLKSIDDKKYVIFGEDGKEHKVDLKKVVLTKAIYLEPDLNSSEKKLKLRNLRKELELSKLSIDIKSIWEDYSDRKDTIEISEILESYKDNNGTLLDELKLFWAIDKDDIYFHRYEIGYLPNSKEVVDKKFSLLEIKRVKEQERTLAVKWFADIAQGLKEPAVDEKFINYIELIENYIIHLSRYERQKEAKDFLHDINLKSIENVVEFLIKIGYWNADDDHISKRYYYSSQSSKSSEKELNDILNEKGLTDSFVDRTNLDIFSIDDEGTFDIDDAISFEVKDNKLILGVHISNVASVVSKDSSLDIEARSRGESVYFPETTLNMFPQRLVKEKLTLDAEKLVPTVSLFAVFDSSNFNLIEYHIEQSIIKVKNNLVYGEAEQFLVKTDWGQRLIDLTYYLRNKRVNDGAFIVQLPELKLTVDNSSKVLARKNLMVSLPHKVVSECMILMNSLSAKFLVDNQLPSIFRSQNQDIDDSGRLLDYEDILFPTKVTKYLKPTRVVTTPLPHKSLGIDCYIQVTSPIRRYMDLVMQRQITNYLNDGTVSYSVDELENINMVASLNVREIKNSQKSRHRYWLLKYLLQNGIREAIGYVSYSSGKKINVYLPDFLLDLPLSNAGSGQLNEGDKIEVEFFNINPLRRKIYIQPLRSV